MQVYLDSLKLIKEEGSFKSDRTGTGTKSIFGHQMRFNLLKGFPLLSTKKIHIKSVIHELIWFLAGNSNIKYLQDNGVKIWDEWATGDGSLGPIYPTLWRSYPTSVPGKTIDQISELMSVLRKRPDSRRHVITAWEPGTLPDESILPQDNVLEGRMALAPCHCLFQFYVSDMSTSDRLLWLAKHNPAGLSDISKKIYNRATDVVKDKQVPVSFLYLEELSHTISSSLLDEYNESIGDSNLIIPNKKLSCQTYQRSADFFLGVPFNIASYSFLTHMIADQLGMAAGDYIWTGGDCHIYNNHENQVKEQLTRVCDNELPRLRFGRKPDSIFDYKFEDFIIENYNPLPAIPAPVAV